MGHHKNNGGRSQRAAESEAKKVAAQKQANTDAKAAMDKANLASDLDNILKDAGIAKTNAMQDYINNSTAIAQNKAADVATVNDYVKTNSERTGEDLNTSLAKEARRYSLQYDKTNQQLADNGMTFSDRTPEKIDAADNAQNTTDINTIAARSFSDIARYEAAQTTAIENKYGQQTTATDTARDQTLAKVQQGLDEATQKNQQGQQGITFQQGVDTQQNTWDKNDVISSIDNSFAQQANSNKNANS